MQTDPYDQMLSEMRQPKVAPPVDPYDQMFSDLKSESAASPRGQASEITSAFGRPRPYGGHTGNDYGWSHGEPVGAAALGKVIFAGQRRGYGNRVEIQHPDGRITTYSHLDGYDVQPGMEITAGQPIGRVGNTGTVRGRTGNNLHFEVLVNGRKVDSRQTDLSPFRIGVSAKPAPSRTVQVAPASGNAPSVPLQPARATPTTPAAPLPAPVAPVAIPPASTPDLPAEMQAPAGATRMRAVNLGLIESGNIDLLHRPVVKNKDGSISTVRSISTNIDGREVLLPTVSDDGRILTNDQAIEQYKRTGKHLGIFDSPENATTYAQSLHKEQGQLYAKPSTDSRAEYQRKLSQWKHQRASVIKQRQMIAAANTIAEARAAAGIGTPEGDPISRVLRHRGLPALPAKPKPPSLLPVNQRAPIVSPAGSQVTQEPAQGRAEARIKEEPASMQAYKPSVYEQVKQTVLDNAPGLRSLNTQEGPTTAIAEEAINRAVNAATLGITNRHVDESRFSNEDERFTADVVGGATEFVAALAPLIGMSKAVSLAKNIPTIARGIGVLEKSGALGRLAVRAGEGAATFGGVAATREGVRAVKGESGGAGEAARNIARDTAIGGAFGVTEPLSRPLRAATVAGATYGIERAAGADNTEALKSSALNALFAVGGESGTEKTPRAAQEAVETASPAETPQERPLRRTPKLEVDPATRRIIENGRLTNRMVDAGGRVVPFVTPKPSAGADTATQITPLEPATTPEGSAAITPTVESAPVVRVRHSNPNIDGGRVIKREGGKVVVENKDNPEITHTIKDPRRGGNQEATLVRESVPAPVRTQPNGLADESLLIGPSQEAKWLLSPNQAQIRKAVLKEIGAGSRPATQLFGEPGLIFDTPTGERIRVVTAYGPTPPGAKFFGSNEGKTYSEGVNVIREKAPIAQDTPVIKEQGQRGRILSMSSDQPDLMSGKEEAANGQAGTSGRSENEDTISRFKRAFPNTKIDPREIKIGDSVRTRSDETVAGVTGIVKSIGRVNVKVETEYFLKDEAGQHIKQLHTIPRSDIVEAMRGVEPVAEKPEPIYRRMKESQGTPTSTKVETTRQERASRGLSPVEQQAYQAIGDSYFAGRDAVEQGRTDPRSLAQSVAEKPRVLSAEEVGALGHDRARLINEHRQTLKEISDAIDKMDENGVADGRARLARIEKDLDYNDQALERGGREQSAAFNARKMLIRDDYSLASVIQRAKARAGTEISPEVRTKLASLTKQLEDAEAKLSQSEEAYKKLQAQKAVRRIQDEAARETRRTRRATTKVDLDNEFALLSKQFGQKVGAQLNANPLDPELVSLIGKMAKNRVLSGVNSVEGLVDEIHAKLKDYVEDKRDIRDAISGYGVTAEMSKDPLAIQLRDMKRQMRLVSAIEDAQSGERPAKTGLQREAESPKVKELRRQLDALMRESGMRRPVSDESRVKTRQSALEKQITELDRRIQAGDFLRSARKPSPTNPQIEQLKTERDKLRAEYDSLKPPSARDPLPTIKNRLTKQIAELESKIARGDFTKPPTRQRPVYDEGANRLKVERDRLKQQIDQEILRQQKPHPLDYLTKWRRFILLSSVRTLGKLTAAATGRAVQTPVEEVIGLGLSKAMPGLARRAPREGNLNITAEAKALKTFFEKATMKDAWKVLTTGQSSLDVQFGKPHGANSPFWDFFGRLHGTLKTPAKRAEFMRSVEKRAEYYRRQGRDLTDPAVQMAIGAEAYVDANRAILMSDNAATDLYRSILGLAERRGGLTGKVAATALRMTLPIVKVPTNYVIESSSFIPGVGAAKGITRIIAARGFERMTPEHADATMRAFKKQGLGMGLFALGYFGFKSVGGYYEQGEKRDPKDAQFGELKLFGVHIPRQLLHIPALEVMQFGATIARTEERLKHVPGSRAEGVFRGAKGLIEEIPFVETPIRAGEAMKSSGSVRRGLSEFGKSMIVPPDVEYAAKRLDRDAQGQPIKRYPQSFAQTVEAALPILRRRVSSEKPKRKSSGSSGDSKNISSIP